MLMIFDLTISNKFSSSQKKLIRGAWDLMANRISAMESDQDQTADFNECMFSNTQRNQSFDGDYLPWWAATRISGTGLPGNKGVSINHKNDPDLFWWGSAPIGLKSGEVRFTVNAAKMNSNSDSRRWATVFFHEILHNMGFNHPKTGGGYEDDYKYTQIEAAENCLFDTSFDFDAGFFFVGSSLIADEG